MEENRSGELNSVEDTARMVESVLNNLSHEIRTSLNVVIGMAELTLREDLNANARAYITQIRSSSEALLNSIDDEISLCSIDTGNISVDSVEYEPVALMDDIADAIKSKVLEKAELIISVDAMIPHILVGDRQHIRQIMLKMSNVAIKHSTGGMVRVRVSYSSKHDAGGALEVHISGKCEDSGLLTAAKEHDILITEKLLGLLGGTMRIDSSDLQEIKIVMTIPQETADAAPSMEIYNRANIVAISLFKNRSLADAFEKGAERLDVPAITLGPDDAPELLYQAILEKHPNSEVFIFMEFGELTPDVEKVIENHPDITAVMVFGLNVGTDIKYSNMTAICKPLSTMNLVRLFNHEMVEGQIYGGLNTKEDFVFIAPEARVLIVDDDPVNLTVAEGLLEPLNMQVRLATGGMDALRKIEQTHYDLIFMDYMMPELDGVETVRLIRNNYPDYADVPIIALTATVESGIREMFESEGMNDFISKPVEMSVLTSKVRQWLPDELIVRTEGKDYVATSVGETVKQDDAGSAREGLPALIKKMREAVEELDTDAMDAAVYAITSAAATDEEKEFARRLSEAADNIDAEECENIINEWEASIVSD